MLNRPPVRIALGIFLIGFAILLSMAAFASWQADSAAEAGNWPRAIAWRPDVALYHLRLGELNIATDPRLAERELSKSMQLDPYSPIAAADLATVQISLKMRQQASLLTQQMSRTSSFDERWRYANLHLMNHDLEGFWEETQRACAIADSDVFASVIARALTASGYDFHRLYQVLPHQNDWAAEAFLNAAVEYRQLKTTQEDQVPAESLGYRWLLSLKPIADPYAQRLREAAAEKYLQDLMEHSPAAVPGVWREGRQAGLFHGAPMHLNGELIAGGNFPHPIPTESFPEPTADSPTRMLGWVRDDSGRVLVNTVFTGDRRYPTSLALSFDGDEHDQVKMAHQWFLARPGTAVTLSAVARSIRANPSGGVVLIVRNRYRAEVARLALAAPPGWRRTETSLVLPELPRTAPKLPDGGTQKDLIPSPIEVYELTVEYDRPLGALPLNNVIAVTNVSLKTVASRPAEGTRAGDQTVSAGGQK